MNKIFALSLSLVAAAAFVGCSPSEEDDIFPDSAANRLNDAEGKYSNILTSSPGGWAMEYYCTNDTLGDNGSTDYRAVGYLLAAKFNSNGTVDMGMNNSFSYNRYLSDNSLWDIVTDTGPVLSFSSYNRCIHAFCNPDDLPASIKGADASDVTGLGAEGDFEFVLTNMQADAELGEIKGKKRGTYVRLTRLPEGTDFNKYISDCDSFRNVIFGASNISEPVMRIGSAALCINSTSKAVTPKIYPYQGDSILTMYRRPFLITKRDGNYYLRFKANFVTSADTSCQEFVYNEETKRFVGVSDTSASISPYPATQLVNDKFVNGATWRAKSNGDMSDDFAEAINGFTSALRRYNYSINQNNLDFTKEDGENTVRLTISLRLPRNRRATIVYHYAYSFENGQITLNYQGPDSDYPVSETLLSSIPDLQTMLNKFSGSFTVTNAGNPYNLTTVHLVSASNSNSWISLNYSR